MNRFLSYLLPVYVYFTENNLQVALKEQLAHDLGIYSQRLVPAYEILQVCGMYCKGYPVIASV